MTALRLDAEAVADPALAERLQQHIAVLQRSIDAIVKEARRPVRTDLPVASDAVATVRERVTFWGALAEDQRRPMRVILPPGPLHVPVAGDDLADLVDVLVDNVFAHTPDGTPFEVELADRWRPPGPGGRGPRTGPRHVRAREAAPAAPGSVWTLLGVRRRAAAVSCAPGPRRRTGVRVEVRLPRVRD